MHVVDQGPTFPKHLPSPDACPPHGKPTSSKSSRLQHEVCRGMDIGCACRPVGASGPAVRVRQPLADVKVIRYWNLQGERHQHELKLPVHVKVHDRVAKGRERLCICFRLVNDVFKRRAVHQRRKWYVRNDGEQWEL